MKEKTAIHPAVKDLKNDMDHGRISRREFLRMSTLLGLSAASAFQMAGWSFPGKAWAGTPRRGGILKIANPCQKIGHPAAINFGAASNVIRQVSEHLTYTDEKNITHPFLLENWQVSDDLKTWVLNCRKGITFNSGGEFTADDVIFTFNQWLDKDIGSGMYGILNSYLDQTGIEKTGDYQVTLHLKRPEIGLPEHLFSYMAFVLNHRTFEGDFLKSPDGTGPYLLKSYDEFERAVFKPRTDYWQKGVDGHPLPYLDGIEFHDIGQDSSPLISALKDGQIHNVFLGDGLEGTPFYNAFKNNPDFTITPVETTEVKVLRLRCDLKPWDDNRVRTALKLCQNREKIQALAAMGHGLMGHDTHVAPIHPEYCPKELPEYDPQKAKALLKEAGYADGITFDLVVPGGWEDSVRYAEILKEDAAPAGFDVQIKTTAVAQYWEKWREFPAGITQWGARPLGTMVLNLAYDIDDSGEPVQWNETRWKDPEFHALLATANGILDREERRKIFCKLEQIQMDRGSIGISWWGRTWLIAARQVHGIVPHPSTYLMLHRAWMEKTA
jgi:peptide/nickel transport system substrate-binding protein